MAYLKERLKSLRKERAINQTELAKAVGVTLNTYSQYEGRGRLLPTYLLCRLSEYYNVSTDYILGYSDARERAELWPSNLTLEEINLLEHYRTADERGRENIRITSEHEAERIKKMQGEQGSPGKAGKEEHDEEESISGKTDGIL